jgi:hypothetical protein
MLYDIGMCLHVVPREALRHLFFQKLRENNNRYLSLKIRFRLVHVLCNRCHTIAPTHQFKPSIVKMKLAPYLPKYHAMKMTWVNGGIAPCTLNLGSRQLHSPAAFPPGKEPPVHIGQEAGGRREENSCLCRESNPARRVVK